LDEGWSLLREALYFVKELVIENASTFREEDWPSDGPAISEDQIDSFSLVRR
jgi:hypothetical protein